jgi:hypothetical protein
MKQRASIGFLLIGMATACHRIPAAPDDAFDQQEKLFTGQHSRIIEAAGRALVQSQVEAERQYLSYDGATVIIAHPASSPSATGSVVVRLKEVGSDDTSVGVQIKRSLLPLPADRIALASKIMSTIAEVHDK